jgi:hypothetical protein
MPTPNKKEIVVLSSFFQRGFGLLLVISSMASSIIIKLSQSTLTLTSFSRSPFLCICVKPSSSCLLAFLYSKAIFHEISAQCQPVIDGVGLQTCPCSGFLDLPMKTTLKGWHKSWFYYENHEPSPPPFVGRLPEFNKIWSEEPTTVKLPVVATLANRVNDLKRHGLTGVCVAANWLAHWLTPLKKQVHLGWEYDGIHDLTWETLENIRVSKMVKLQQELFTNTTSWPTVEQVCAYHIGMERDPVRQLPFNS